MTNTEYQEAAKRTDKDLGSLKENLTHMVLGLTTETGELADVLKRNHAYGKEMDPINEIEEIGDLLWYIANYCNHRNFTIEKAMEINIAKLKKRYPEKFNEHEALNRDLSAERQTLEEGAGSC